MFRHLDFFHGPATTGLVVMVCPQCLSWSCGWLHGWLIHYSSALQNYTPVWMDIPRISVICGGLHDISKGYGDHDVVGEPLIIPHLVYIHITLSFVQTSNLPLHHRRAGSCHSSLLQQWTFTSSLIFSSLIFMLLDYNTTQMKAAHPFPKFTTVALQD